ncbi:MAG TPA: ABC transporter permease [Candidatus Angelobacter sp.]|nr:ABC transporter permease [Candidatus Angelobacter sp.]HKR94937.1 ABC transporter permease [Candidatus Angelobacter sp.]
MRSNLVREDMKMALETVRNHKVRSFLTVLGVVIGTMVAIVVASILLGVEKGVQDSLNEFGVDNLFILKFDPGFHFGRLSPEERTRKSLTYDDGMAIKDNLPAVKNVVVEALPHIGDKPQPIRTARNKSHELTNIIFRGVTASYSEVVNGKMKEGRFFTDQEDLHRQDVVVIGFDTEKSLFPDELAEGKQLLVDGNMYTIIGVFEKKKNSMSNAGDNEVLIPYRTYQKHYPQDDENFIIAMAQPGMKNAAEDEVRGLLRMRRRVPPDKPDNFGISSAEALGNQFRDIMAGLFKLVVGIVSIGLLVGGVGVMNIMLMSVTERTREIGVRKAIGARKRDISFQFITEAMTLTGIGGILGVILSLLISLLLNLIHFPSSVPVWAIILAVAVASSVGLFFGIYPAMKAARLDPVIALRYE